MYTHPKKRSSGHRSGPGTSCWGCGPGKHSVSSASFVSKVGTEAVQDRFSTVDGATGCAKSVLPVLSVSVRGDGRAMPGDPGQFEAVAGDCAFKGLSVDC